MLQVTEEQASLAEAPPLEANQAFKAAVFPKPSHCTVKSEATTAITGLVSSIIVKVAEVVEAFPQASVAVKVTVAEPVAPQVSETEVKLLLQVTEEQASLAEAPPLEANQAFKAAVFPKPSHCTVKSEASVAITGLVSSTMVKVAEVVEAFPQASVAVKVTVAEPVAPQVSETEVKLLLQVTEEQASLAEAPPLEANQAFKAAVFPKPSHCTVKSEA